MTCMNLSEYFLMTIIDFLCPQFQFVRPKGYRAPHITTITWCRITLHLSMADMRKPAVEEKDNKRCITLFHRNVGKISPK